MNPPDDGHVAVRNPVSALLRTTAIVVALTSGYSACNSASDTTSPASPSSGVDGGDAGADTFLDGSHDAGSDTMVLIDVVQEAACKESVGVPLDPALGVISPEFAQLYHAYDLGPVPPVKAGDPVTSLDPLGGCVIASDDPNKLYFVGNSERSGAAVYAVRIKRDDCGHITGFEGNSTWMAAVDYADANLVYAPGGVLFVPQYPVAKLSQLDPSFGLIDTTDLIALGIDGPVNAGGVDLAAGESPGGIGLVPAYLQSKGELRTVGYPSGRWYHLGMKPAAVGYEIDSATSTVMLDNGPGAFDYIPPGSPGFAKPAVILTEWFRGRYGQEKNDNPTPENQRVAVYEVDEAGDPVPTTRKEFFASFDRPWGAYFEPVTGDFLFLSWLKAPDHIVAVRGFVPPPPVPK